FLWNVETGQEVRRFRERGPALASLAFSPDGRQVLSGGVDGPVQLWDVDTAREVRRFEAHSWWGWGVAFSPDGRRALAASADGACPPAPTGRCGCGTSTAAGGCAASAGTPAGRPP